MDKKNNEKAVNIDDIQDRPTVEIFTHKSQNWCATGILGKKI